jgi:hypothetical protein
MIDLKTVLILGAGASKDFGFPTGRGLVSLIINSFSNRMEKAYRNLVAIAGEQKAEETMKFTNTLKLADPPSVDIWLEQNPDYIEIGKITIAMTLLGCERHSNLRPDNNWYQLLFDRLNSPFDEFQNNKLAIVTFNYDRSLEYYFFRRFRNTHTKKREEECKEKLSQLKIIHIYGSLGRLEWQFDDPKNLIPQVPYGAEWTKNTIIWAANSIEIMSEQSSGVDRKLEEFCKLMQNCQALYFLGFGYHDINMQRLGIDTLAIPRKVMGTAQGLSYQRMIEIERLGIRDLQIPGGLFPKSIYDFLHQCVNFDESTYPIHWVYKE